MRMESLRAGAGETVQADALLAVTKALLQSGVASLGGYPGGPISPLISLFARAAPLFSDLGVELQSSTTPASAAALLAASVHHPRRTAVALPSVSGTNAASDALSNLASAGVTGGALILVGEDYGEATSAAQERTHALALKSQIWLLDPRPSLPALVAMVEAGFQLSEASHTPVILQLRPRTCHLSGQFTAADNQLPPPAASPPPQDTSRIVLHPANLAHEQEKIARRRPAALAFIQAHKLNEQFGPETHDLGLIVQGGLYNSLIRALQHLGLADAQGQPSLPIYCLNVPCPLVPQDITGFCADKRAVLLVEEGQPEFIEHELNTLLRRASLGTSLHGKDLLPRAGEYTVPVLRDGLTNFLRTHAPSLGPPASLPEPAPLAPQDVPARPPGLCTGCPERPVFTALKLLERELGPANISADVGCHQFASQAPFHLGHTSMGQGLSTAATSPAGSRPLAIMGDGGFWQAGLTASLGNAVHNQQQTVTLILDNGVTAVTGGQPLPSALVDAPGRSTRHPIEVAARGIGALWVRTVKNPYALGKLQATLREALTSATPGPKVIVSQSECTLTRQRREAPLAQAARKAGKRTTQTRYGIDPDTCTGDHSCIRLSGCPSLTIAPNPDPLRQHPIAQVNNDCTGCGLCGEVAHAAILCPSFYKARLTSNPSPLERWRQRLRTRLISRLQARAARSRAARGF